MDRIEWMVRELLKEEWDYSVHIDIIISIFKEYLKLESEGYFD